ncbi:MAG: GEVED domain-containing protein, partial [Planctomycetia bacterium]|nr:GEVED domain-containing protein [Planctomycetia bacterium]
MFVVVSNDGAGGYVPTESERSAGAIVIQVRATGLSETSPVWLNGWFDLDKDSSYTTFVDAQTDEWNEQMVNNLRLTDSGVYRTSLTLPSVRDYGSFFADIETTVRFRVSTGMVSGEQSALTESVEHSITIVNPGRDLGDAPDTYGTTLANDGVWHWYTNTLSLGETVLVDTNGQPSTAADLDLSDDGVEFIAPTQPSGQLDNPIVVMGHEIPVYTVVSADGTVSGEIRDAIGAMEHPYGAIIVKVRATEISATNPVYVSGWLDWEADGVFGSGVDQLLSSVPLTQYTTVDNLSGTSVTIRAPGIDVTGNWQDYQTYLRVRVSHESGLTSGSGSNVELADGEVEDYQVSIVAPGLDFGDTPDTYGTTIANGGVWHWYTETLSLGETVTVELDGQPSTAADLDEGDDGVEFIAPTRPSGELTNPILVMGYEIPVYMVVSADGTVSREIREAIEAEEHPYGAIIVKVKATEVSAANPVYVSGWLDWKADGVFSTGWTGSDGSVWSDRLLSSVALTRYTTVGNLAEMTTVVRTPGISVTGDRDGRETYLRFRVSHTPGLTASGNADVELADGEVEDYRVSTATPEVDFGNAPDTYGTKEASDGPRHSIAGTTTWLGETVDAEDDYDPAAVVTDNDGVTIVSPLANQDGTATSRNMLAMGQEIPVYIFVSEDGTEEAAIDSHLEENLHGWIVVRVAAQDLANEVVYLNGWLDTDGDGTFEWDEHLIEDLAISDKSLVNGLLKTSITLPAAADQSDLLTWLRFRVSHTSGLGATTDSRIDAAALPDGEVEDYALTLLSDQQTVAGYVFHDIDFSRSRGEGEVGLQNRLVYIDLNENGVRDEFEPSTHSASENFNTILNEAGAFAFEGLTKGQYLFRVEFAADEQANWVSTNGDTYIQVPEGQMGVAMVGLYQKATITIDDVLIEEGDLSADGTRESTSVIVTISREDTFGTTITVGYQTEDGTASGTSAVSRKNTRTSDGTYLYDYLSVSDTVTMSPDTQMADSSWEQEVIGELAGTNQYAGTFWSGTINGRSYSWVVWLSTGASGDAEVYWLDLTDPDATPQVINTPARNASRPSISGNLVVWSAEPADVVNEGPDREVFVCELPLLTGGFPSVYQLTHDDVSSENPQISGSMILWESGDQMIRYDLGLGVQNAVGAVDDVVTVYWDLQNPDERISVLDVLSNDGGVVTGTTVPVIVEVASHGVASVTADGQIRYTPAAGFTGEDQFRYQITDTEGNVSEAIVSVTVTNNRSRAVDDEVTVYTDLQETGLSESLDVLANDGGIDEGCTLLIGTRRTDQPSHGTVEVVDGRILYTPDEGYTGEDEFHYIVRDRYGYESKATVTVTVTNSLVDGTV